jgi:hypothetical protein
MTTFVSDTATIGHTGIANIIRPTAINVEETTGL